MTDLPVPVKQAAHYRVLYRPSLYEQEKVGSLKELWEIVERNKLSLRGWDYPHISSRGGTGQGTHWIACWSSFMGLVEYWRFYQSTQFLYLGAVREMSPEWHDNLKRTFRPLNGAPVDIPGFVSIVNLIYTMTEFFEFPTRLCQAGLYQGTLTVTVEMHGIRGFALTTDDPRRHWHRLCQSTEDTLQKTWRISSTDLIASSNEHSLDAMVWFFERFGWRDVSRDALRADQEDFLAGRF